MAEHVVESDLRGHPSHGTLQLPGYRDQHLSGEHDLAAEPEVTAQEGVVTRIDGRGGLGQPAMALAVERAAASAEAQGLGAAAIVRCGHTGRMGAWTERAAERGMASVMLTAWGEEPYTVALAPGTRPVLHTNPIALGVPAPEGALVLDMATSVIAEGKAMVAQARGERLPEGVLVDAQGRPTTDPADFRAGGALLPAGGYKGFGLSVMIEALALGLLGADAPGLRPASGALVICIRADLFRGADEQGASAEQLRERLHASGVETEVLAPGELERRRSEGARLIDVGDDLLAILEETAARHGG